MKKTIHAELKDFLAQRFEHIKSSLGIQNDAEVMRFLIQSYFKEHLEKKDARMKEEVQADTPIINQFMEKYGEEWRKLGEDE